MSNFEERYKWVDDSPARKPSFLTNSAGRDHSMEITEPIHDHGFVDKFEAHTNKIADEAREVAVARQAMKTGNGAEVARKMQSLSSYSFGPGGCEVTLFTRQPPLSLPLTQTDEVRSVNPTTGAEKGVKLARYDLIPAAPLRELAEHFGRGAQKYADRNWERGIDWSKNFAALQRHAWAWWDGETNDSELGNNHLVAVAWHAFALLEYAMTHPELDDRPKNDTDS